MRHKVYSDKSWYSRNNLGPALQGEEYARRLTDMELGSRVMLKQLWREHPRILRALEAQGNMVVHP